MTNLPAGVQAVVNPVLEARARVDEAYAAFALLTDEVAIVTALEVLGSLETAVKVAEYRAAPYLHLI